MKYVRKRMNKFSFLIFLSIFFSIQLIGIVNAEINYARLDNYWEAYYPERDSLALIEAVNHRYSPVTALDRMTLDESGKAYYIVSYDHERDLDRGRGYVYSFDGSVWTKIFEQAPSSDSNYILFSSIEFFSDKIYVGDDTGNVYVINKDGTFVQKLTFEKNPGRINDFRSFGNKLYIAGNKGLFKVEGNSVSSISEFDGAAINSLEVYKNKLYISSMSSPGTRDSVSSIKKMSSDGKVESGEVISFRVAVTSGSEARQVTALKADENYLYFSSSSSFFTCEGYDTARLYKYDGNNVVKNIDSGESYIHSIENYNGKNYIGSVYIETDGSGCNGIPSFYSRIKECSDSECKIVSGSERPFFQDTTFLKGGGYNTGEYFLAPQIVYKGKMYSVNSKGQIFVYNACASTKSSCESNNSDSGGNPIVVDKCSNSNDIILRISDKNNAHSEVWNGANNYPVEICYSKIFGKTGPLNAHQCETFSNGENNRVLRLSSESNANVEGPKENNYQTSVCYGNLVCDLKSSCASNEKEVLRLSSQTNAHVSIEQNEQYKICCKENSESIIEPSGPVLWKDCRGVALNENSKLGVGGTVYMTYEDSNIKVGDKFVIELRGRTTLIGSVSIKTIPIEETKTAGKLITKLILEKEDLGTRVTNPGEVSRPYSSIYFVVKDSLGRTLGTSNNIVVDQSLQNSAPSVEIKSPVADNICKNLYFVGSKINFESEVIDNECDSLVYEWNIGETISNNDKGPDFPKKFDHIYTSTGAKEIKLKVTDSRGLSTTKSIGISILSSSSASYAFIGKPKESELIPVEYGNKDKKLDYSAEESYILKIIRRDLSEGICEVSAECIGGSCPAKTCNSPSCAGGSGVVVSNSPAITGRVDYSKMNFTWTFYLSNDKEKSKARINLLGDQGVRGNVEVYKSSTNGEKIIELLLTSSESGVLESKAERRFNLGQCVEDGTSWVYLQNNLLMKQRTNVDGKFSNGKSYCYGNGNENAQCCPAGERCDENKGCIKGPGFVPSVCKDYKSLGQKACNDDDYKVVKNDPTYKSLVRKEEACESKVYSENGREYLSKCSCAWDSATNDKCVLKESRHYITNNGKTEDFGECSWETLEETECNEEGIKIIKVSAKWTGIGSAPETCKNKEEAVPCGRQIIELPFFNFSQMFITILFIFLVYLSIFIKKRL